MTEKTILDVVQEYGVTTEQAVKAIQEYVSKHQPAFEVGEYYFDKDVNRIVKIENHETSYTEIKYLSDDKLQNSVLYNLEDYFESWEPATTEQIATFKLAEIKSDIGLIIKNGDDDWIEIVEDIEEYLTEELQEVRNDGKPNQSS